MFRTLTQLMVVVTMLAMLASCGPAADPGATSSPRSAPDTTSDHELEASPDTESASSDTTPNGAEPINVVATTSIMADLIQNVGGERVNVRSLLPPGVDPHTYSPTPRDVQAVAGAQIVFENGLGLEEWLDEVIANAGGERPIATVTEGISPIEGGHDQADDEHDDDATPETNHRDDQHSTDATAEAGDNHSHAVDPHMWFDVQRTIRYVENIRDGLKAIDGDGAQTYDANARTYIQQLEALDREIQAQLQTIPAENRKIVTNHDTFGYFAERYGFEIVGTVFRGVSTEQEPSAQQIAALVRAIEEQNVPAIFTEDIVNPRLAEQIADEADVQVVTNLYTDALSEPGGNAESYIAMMRHNVEQIVEALR